MFSIQKINDRLMISNLGSTLGFSLLSISLKKNKDLDTWFYSYKSSRRRYSIKKTVLEISQYHLRWSLFLIKLQAYKKRLQHRCFPVNIARVLRTPILKNILERLLLPLGYITIKEYYSQTLLLSLVLIFDVITLN